MRTALRTFGVATIVLFIGGCGKNIPPKLQVRDVSSGKLYTTYKPWGEVTKGTGYEFTDIETGNRVTLTNYEVSTIESEKTVPNDSPDARAFEDARVRGGVK